MRSKFEEDIARRLTASGCRFEYETDKIRFLQPAVKRLYNPDFKVFRPDGSFYYIEAKGLFSTADRKKHLMIAEQHPDLDIRLLFQAAENKISNTSQTTYAKWAESKGIPWANGGRYGKVPAEWLDETS